MKIVAWLALAEFIPRPQSESNRRLDEIIPNSGENTYVWIDINRFL
jgi:hypothetical protein